MRLFIPILLATSVLLLFNFFKQSKPNPTLSDVKPELPKNYEVASWVWKSPDKLSDIEMDSLIQKAKEAGIDTIYLSIDRYIDISESRNKSKIDDQKNFDSSLQKFIELANKAEIKVQGLAGNVNWANENYSYIPLMLTKYAIDFNKRSTQKLSGIHFDIEFHSQDNYQDNIEKENLLYLKLLENLRTIVKNNPDPDFEMGFDVNPFLDNKNDNNIVFQIMDILNSMPQSNLVLMAYRNEAEGKNGSIQAVKNELSYAKANAPNIKILIGQETDQNKDKNTTFYGFNKKYFWKEVLKIVDYYKDNPSVHGIAIHHLISYLSLEE
jgi:hypothetical protein